MLVLAGRHPGLVPEIETILLEHFAATTVACRADEVVETIALLPSYDLEDGMTDDPFEPSSTPIPPPFGTAKPSAAPVS